jgi:D-alanyl-D-alanine dipeptidase
MRLHRLTLLVAAGAAVLSGCAPRVVSTSAPMASPIDGARDLVLVTTSGWDETSGVLRRFSRQGDEAAWSAVGEAVPVVVGRTGLAWDDSRAAPVYGAPVKREGDGRAPAGAFPLDTAFGFAPRASVPWVRLPYVGLLPTTECVDDVRSTHYNTIVDRRAVARVDWTSSEQMRQIDQYRLGVHVAYNAPPRASRGSCIFLHVWAGPGTSTAGCTAMEESKLAQIVRWLVPERRPMLVQLPESELARLRGAWGLP